LRSSNNGSDCTTIHVGESTTGGARMRELAVDCSPGSLPAIGPLPMSDAKCVELQ
jgi:hypothetical protein